jgi:hypothetical protein
MVTTDGVRSAQATSGGTVRRRSADSSITLTGRGGIVLIFGVGLLSEFFGNLVHLGFLPGLGFVVACALAAAATRGGDLLTVVVSPPLVFLAITVISEFIGAIGERSLLRSMVVGVVTTFASRAPWLFFGTALAIVVALPRGLPATLRALRAARPPRSAPATDVVDDPVAWDD